MVENKEPEFRPEETKENDDKKREWTAWQVKNLTEGPTVGKERKTYFIR